MATRGNTNMCFQHPEFMHNICPLSCGVCGDGVLSDVLYWVVHYPEQKISPAFCGFVGSLRTLFKSLAGVGEISFGAAAVFLVLGLLLAFNIVFFETATKTKSSNGAVAQSDSASIMTIWDQFVLILATCLCCALKIFMSTPRYQIPIVLRSFHGDLSRVASEADIYVALIIGGIIAHIYIKTVVTFMCNDTVNNTDIAYFIAVMAASIAAALGFVFFIVENDAIRWNSLWDYRKNAAFAFVMLGALISSILLPLKKILIHVIAAESLVVLVIPNLFIVGGIKCLARYDRSMFLELMRTFHTNKLAALALVLFGMAGGLMYMKLIDKLTNEDVTNQAQTIKVKVD
jgi:hypothetical protein